MGQRGLGSKRVELGDFGLRLGEARTAPPGTGWTVEIPSDNGAKKVDEFFFFFNAYLLILGEQECMRTQAGEGQRENQTEPDTGLDLTN